MALLARFEKDFTDDAGNLITGNVNVTVTLEGGGVVSLYDGRDSTTANLLGDPFVNDGGRVVFHCAGGAYRVDVMQGALTRTLRYVAIGLLAEKDALTAAAVSFTPGSGVTATNAQAAIEEVAGTAKTAGVRNRLINGNGAINQRVATSQADDTYAWDRHYVLTQTAAIGVSTLSDVADGLPSMMRLSQSQASAQRMGVAQIIESVNCKDLRGQAVTLLGKLRCSSSQAIRYAILEWTGTADAPVSDVVNSWTNGTFTAGQFFNSTTLTVTQVGTITPSAATVTDFLLATTLGSSVNNVIVMIWTEGTAAQNITLDAAWEFVKGNQTGKTYPVAEVRDRGTEQIMCERYFQKSYAAGTAPGAAVGAGNCSITVGGPNASIGVSLPVRNPMRGSPTQIIYDCAGNTNKVSYYNGSWNSNGTISSTAGSNANWVYVQSNIASTPQHNFDYTKEAEL